MAVVLGSVVNTGYAQWKPQVGPLKTRWAADVNPERVLPEYPRPQMVRRDWLNLNGLWEYAIRPKDEGRPTTFDGQILVPFPVESALSGVMKRVDEKQRLWYRRTFETPAAWASYGKPGAGPWVGRRVVLHFGAVDWESTVWVNGKEVGTHRGGYAPFTFDITDAVKPGEAREIVVAVWDPTDAGPQPRGKQVQHPEGILYTPTTGIWQTVWLEPVPQWHVEALKIVPDVEKQEVEVAISNTGRHQRGGDYIELAVLEDGKEIARTKGDGEVVRIKVPNAKLWSPETPQLYDLKVQFNQDIVTSYFAMRKVAVGKDDAGVMRLMLNNKPVFMFGPLDQGFWPDGLYTAPTDAALRHDIEMIRKLGFNTIRKHVKVEPDRWYYWCDKLGVLVWQDMPSGDTVVASQDREKPRAQASAAQFELELRRMMDALGNHPCIVMWVPFNEGWGQYDTKRITEWVKQYDPSRLVNNASGWTDFGAGDVIDVHIYPGPGAPRPEEKRAAVLGEFGGLGLPVAGHTWQAEKNWGYKSYKDSAELTEAYLKLVAALRPLVADPGLSAALYTQTTDVEIEVNGLMTYDRAQFKVDAERVCAANRRVYEPPPKARVVVPTSEKQGYEWRYTTEQPADGWEKPEFDDSRWQTGPGGFGREGTPGAVVRTAWTTADIWLRRIVELPAEKLTSPYVRVYHDEDCYVYVNGVRVAWLPGYTTNYVLAPISDVSVLKPGRNVLAVRCHQTEGGQGIDVGIVEVKETPEK